MIEFPGSSNDVRIRKITHQYWGRHSIAIVIVHDEMSTLPVALARWSRMLMGVGGTTRAGQVMAAATLTALPIMVVFLIFQRRFVESLTMAGLKG